MLQYIRCGVVHIDTLVLSGTEWFDFILYIMEQDDVASAHMVQNGFLLSAFSWYKMVQNEAVQILYYRKLSSVCVVACPMVCLEGQATRGRKHCL